MADKLLMLVVLSSTLLYVLFLKLTQKGRSLKPVVNLFIVEGISCNPIFKLLVHHQNQGFSKILLVLGDIVDQSERFNGICDFSNLSTLFLTLQSPLLI